METVTVNIKGGCGAVRYIGPVWIPHNIGVLEDPQ